MFNVLDTQEEANLIDTCSFTKYQQDFVNEDLSKTTNWDTPRQRDLDSKWVLAEYSNCDAAYIKIGATTINDILNQSGYDALSSEDKALYKQIGKEIYNTGGTWFNQEES